MDENVLAAALRLNEPITFGRIEPLHDTGRHRSLSPFWNFDDNGTSDRGQDVARRLALIMTAVTIGYIQELGLPLSETPS
jgi:hypothetical protein